MAAFFIFIISLGFQAVQMIMQIGLLKISLKFCDRQTPDYSELYKNYRLFWRYLGASLLVGLVVLGGFILFIVPGIIWAIKYSQVNYLIVDRNYEVMAAFKKSGEMTAGSKWQLFVFFLVLGLVNFLGLLCLGVGLFATIPTSAVAMAFVYRQLFHHAQASPIPAVAAGSRPTPIMPGPGGIQI